jgi:hypothetical protein
MVCEARPRARARPPVEANRKLSGSDGGRSRSAAQACPQIWLPARVGGRRRSLLQLERRLKGFPQSRVVDTGNVVFENSCSLRMIERGDRAAYFAARPAKETWRRWPPMEPERVHFIGHGECGRLILPIPGDGEAQKEQQPFPNSTGPPIAGIDYAVYGRRCGRRWRDYEPYLRQLWRSG